MKNLKILIDEQVEILNEKYPGKAYEELITKYQATHFLRISLESIAHSTAESLRMEDRKYVTQPAEYNGSDANVWREGYNVALTELEIKKAEFFKGLNI